ncbi:hypothetical protein [Dyadobacter sp. 676]|uniref:Outer membrane protein beta-barrel domain-containing protein n=1 Tax=Dyadobacter sp. 676 TaxID=3088362 RepID=A0AAU8FJ56_9BACT
MKNPLVTSLLIILILLFQSNPVISQDFSKLQIGIFAGYGKDYYNRKLNGAGGIPDAKSHFASKHSIEVGAYGEKFVAHRISVLVRTYYSNQNVPTNTLCNCNHLDYLQKERHHIVSLGLSLRGYLSGRSLVKLVAGLGLQTEYFLGYSEKRNDSTRFHGNAQEYNRFNPRVSGEMGLQWKRIGLFGEYKGDLGNTFSKRYRLSTGGEVRRSIFRHGYSIKLSFLLTKPVSN